MSLSRKALVLGMGEGVARVLGIVLYGVLARILSVADFGVLSYAMTFGLLVSVLVDFGQNALIGRSAARDEHGGRTMLVSILANKLSVGLLATVVVGVVAHLVGSSASEFASLGLMVLWASILSALDAIRFFGRSRDMMTSDAVVNGGESVLRIAAVAVAWYLGAGLTGISAAYPIASAVALVAFIWFVLLRRQDSRLAFPTYRQRFDVIRISTPLGLSAIAMSGFYRLDQVLVRLLAGAEASAYYGAAARLVFAATVAAILVGWAGYADMSRAHSDRKAMVDVIKRSMLLSGGIGLAAAVVLAAGAPIIISTVFGAQYGPAVPVLRVLALVVLLNAVSTIALNAANALHCERQVLVLVAALLVTNGVLNVLLVPRFGAIAAAGISAAGEACLAAGLLLLVRARLSKLGDPDAGTVPAIV